jgi:hypothetical protein
MPKKLYTIFCVITGESTVFPIKIQKSEPVDILKDKIKEARRNTLAQFDAAQLTLYHVEIPVHADMVTAVKQKLTENPDELQAWEALAEVFKDAPKMKTVHIIVRPPKSGE